MNWKYLYDLYQPTKPEFEPIQLNESIIKSAEAITSVLSLKDGTLFKSRILLYSKEKFIASTAGEGSSGSLAETRCHINPLHLPWATKGTMSFPELHTSLGSAISATAMCNNTMIIAMPKNRNNGITLLYSASLPNQEKVANPAYDYSAYTMKINDVYQLYALTSVDGIVSSLYCPTRSTVYVGTKSGYIQFHDFNQARTKQYELRINNNSITAVVGQPDFGFIAWIEADQKSGSTRLATWDSNKQWAELLDHPELSNVHFTSLDIHPLLPLITAGTKEGKVMLYNYLAKKFYSFHNGYHASFDYDGYLIIIDYQKNKGIMVKRYGFPSATRYPLKMLMLFTKMKEKNITPSELAEPWLSYYSELLKQYPKELFKLNQKICEHRSDKSFRKPK